MQFFLLFQLEHQLLGLEVEMNACSGPNLSIEIQAQSKTMQEVEGKTNNLPDGGDSSKNSLCEQERRTRIAFLQNRQAELETEIRLLKQSTDPFMEQPSSPFVEAYNASTKFMHDQG